MNRLIKRIVELKNPTVVGLDPKLDYIPPEMVERNFAQWGAGFEGAARAVLEFNRGIIDAVCDIVPAVKPQLAYYEMFSYPGLEAYYRTVEYAKRKGMFVIADGKRNDIGSTMEAYGTAHLGKLSVGGQELAPFGADALTVNGYLGSDGVRPLLSLCREGEKGIFVLVKTSNPSSGELQDRLIDGRPVYEIMGEMCEQWGEGLPAPYGYSPVGAVVGATYPGQLAALRKKLPHTFFLVPGYGAQGGGAKDVMGAFDERGLGAVVNSSRAVLTAWKKEGCPGEEYAQAARREAVRMRDDITACIPPITL